MNVILNANIRFKQTEAVADTCIVEKVIEIDRDEFWNLRKDLMQEKEFIRNNRSCMSWDCDGTYHCLLVLEKGSNDGILIEAEGYSYARYSAYVPDARLLLRLKQYPALAELNEKLAELADRLLLASQRAEEDLTSYAKTNLKRDMGEKNSDLMQILAAMLSNREEFLHAGCCEDNLVLIAALKKEEQELVL